MRGYWFHWLHQTGCTYYPSRGTYASAKTCVTDHLRDLESSDASRISSGTSSNDKATHEGDEYCLRIDQDCLRSTSLDLTVIESNGRT